MQLVLIATDQHNFDGVCEAMPSGCVFVGVTLTAAEWQRLPAEAMARQVVLPLVATAQLKWRELLPT